MNKVSIAYVLPFSQSARVKETHLSISVRVTAIVLGIIAATIGVLILLNVTGLGHLGTTAGWPIFSVGAFIVLIGASIKCIKKPQAQHLEAQAVPQEVHSGEPFLVERNLLEAQLVPKQVIREFFALNTGSRVWIGAEKKVIRIGENIGCGGSKRAMEIGEDEVLMLPNSGNGFYIWQRMVDEEVQISDKLTQLGILTVQSKRVDIFLSEESELPLPAYICPSFKALAKERKYVIDGKNSKSSGWQDRSYFKNNEDRFNLENWLPIIKPLLKDIYILARNNCLFYGDALNIIIIENEQGGYIARYFGFDFSEKHAVNNRVYGLREVKVEEILKYLGTALEKVFWEQYDYDTKRKNMVLGENYTALVVKFQRECPRILKKMTEEGLFLH